MCFRSCLIMCLVTIWIIWSIFSDGIFHCATLLAHTRACIAAPKRNLVLSDLDSPPNESLGRSADRCTARGQCGKGRRGVGGDDGLMFTTSLPSPLSLPLPRRLSPWVRCWLRQPGPEWCPVEWWSGWPVRKAVPISRCSPGAIDVPCLSGGYMTSPRYRSVCHIEVLGKAIFFYNGLWYRLITGLSHFGSL